MKSLIAIFLVINSSVLFGQIHPFPNHSTYNGNYIQPNNYSQSELDTQSQLFYDEWKTEYLRNDCGNPDEYYVLTGDGAINVSEAQGYGMMIIAYFAGYEANAQVYFNGLYRFYKSHPSNINDNLMDWQQVSCDDSPSSDDDAASDGDIDIAFALLLAHIQWGSNGDVNYLSEAQAIIDAIMQDEINHNTWTVKLGDWCDSDDANYYFGTRPSDFIIDHFRVFSCFTNNMAWNNVADTCYSLIDNMQNNFSSTSGLIPDFIIDVNSNPSPAGANYLEDDKDGAYYYNACRVPWRLGVDYLINDEPRAGTAINKINSWLITTTSANVNNISNGYELNGTALYSWSDATFLAPFTVGAMADVSNQTWLNNLYEELLTNNNLNDGDYYSNTIKLLSMIVISGNYWIPNCDESGITNFVLNEEDISIYPNSTEHFFTIKLNHFKDVNNNTLGKIIDSNGKVLIENIRICNYKQIDISSFEAGVYFLLLEINNELISKKIIKE